MTWIDWFEIGCIAAMVLLLAFLVSVLILVVTA